ncbi:hypothetical protein DLAC_00727 [Tieghemostelium lacteum]|uniref:KIF-binding protein n=1 Tax=Tieghemostelium lacteum TaxID=361077 RepID=A0A152A7B0_TIELA|nr:hypothetical protein DLAC_00727 [Tieghemostelium lacteum]|eukprot:KYR01937.1 hypothetical protein DLAC_00727 [Tieghemostelium lacteum]
MISEIFQFIPKDKDIWNENLKDIQSLLEVVDDDSTPYASKYKAIETIKSTIIDINNENEDNETLIGILECQLGITYIDTEEESIGFDTLLKGTEKLQEHKNLLIYIKALQNIAVVHINRNDFTNGEECLLVTESLIKENRLKQQQQKDTKPLQSLEIMNYFYQAQVYGLMKNVKLSSGYCLKTLQLQVKLKEQFVYREWCKNALSVGDYYLDQFDFDRSKQCFLASFQVYRQMIADKSESNESSEEEQQETEANIYLFIGKYFLRFLDTQRAISLALNNQDVKVTEELKTMVSQLRFQRTDVEDLFPDLGDLNQVSTHLGYKVDLFKVQNFEQARDIFLKSQHFLNKAKKYYQLDGFVTEYVDLMEMHSDLYKSLLAFEGNPGRQVSIQKKRLELLEPLVKELNPQYYFSALQTIYFRLAEINGEISKIYEIKCSDMREITVYNEFVFKSIQYSKQFLANYNQKGQDKDAAIRDDIQAYIVCKLQLAIMYRNVKGMNKLVHDNLTMALSVFKSVIKDIEDHNQYGDPTRFSTEMNLCKEMIKLLPEKINFLANKI